MKNLHKKPSHRHKVQITMDEVSNIKDGTPKNNRGMTPPTGNPHSKRQDWTSLWSIPLS